jgi:hypothetical protein
LNKPERAYPLEGKTQVAPVDNRRYAYSMMIQSLTKSPVNTNVVVLDVPSGATPADVLAFIGYTPRGTFDSTVHIRDDFSGVHIGKAANVTFWTD